MVNAMMSDRQLSAQEDLAKAQYFLRLANNCRDTLRARALRIYAQYLLDKAVDGKEKKNESAG
jgi:hypothetical protein